jgi:hypothetical protein
MKSLLVVHKWEMWLRSTVHKLLMHSVLAGGVQRQWKGLLAPVGSLRWPQQRLRRPHQRLRRPQKRLRRPHQRLQSECSTSKNT